MNTKKGRLWGNYFYLAGPIDDVTEYEATSWRKDITLFLNSLGIIAIDPCKKEELLDCAFSEIESKEYRTNLKIDGNYQRLKEEVNNYIRHPDLRLVDKSDALIVYLDLDVVMNGTLEEYFWANRCKKPIIVVCPQGKNNIPDWCIAALDVDMMFSTFEEAKKYIEEINSGKTHEYWYSNRWVFIKYDKLFSQIL